MSRFVAQIPTEGHPLLEALRKIEVEEPSNTLEEVAIAIDKGLAICPDTRVHVHYTRHGLLRTLTLWTMDGVKKFKSMVSDADFIAETTPDDGFSLEFEPFLTPTV